MQLSLIRIQEAAASSVQVQDEVLLWDDQQGYYIWRSGLLGKDDREWQTLEVTVTAGRDPRNPAVSQKGGRIRIAMAYDGPTITMGNLIAAATHKSAEDHAVTRPYRIASVHGLDACERARVYIASPVVFTVNGVYPTFRLSPEAVSRFRGQHPELGSLPDPQSHAGSEFYQQYPEMIP